MTTHRLPRIFVVDDEKVITDTLTAILNLSGFDAQAFTNPIEALFAACRTAAPDMLISDVLMPELSGVDLAIAFQQQCPACKILLFSGQADTVDLLQNARAQGYDFHLIAKPIQPSELLRHVREQGPSAECCKPRSLQSLAS